MVTVTAVFAEALPPAPVQESVNVVVALNDPVLCEPEVAFEPDQPPEAVQLVAFVEDQLSVEDCPELIDVGFALSDTVGAGGGALLTVTTALAELLPRGPGAGERERARAGERAGRL